MLCQGEVYLKAPFLEDIKEDTVANQTPGWNNYSGLAYIATCRRAHQEGHPYFYGHNMFFLPCGPTLFALEYFHVLDPLHAALISSLGVVLRFSDLTLDHVKNRLRHHCDPTGSLLAGTDRALLISDLVGTAETVWLDKLDTIRFCRGYTKVQIQWGEHAVLLSGRRLARELRNIRGWCGGSGVNQCNQELSGILNAARKTLGFSLIESLYNTYIDAAGNMVIEL